MNPKNLVKSVYVQEPDIFGADLFTSDQIAFTVSSPLSQTTPLSQIDTLFTGLATVIDDPFLSQFPAVKTVVSNTTGTDHIQTTRPIKLIHLDPADIRSVSSTAEFTFGLLLALTKSLFNVDPHVPDYRTRFRGMQLSGKTLGILGWGRIGQLVGGYAKGFNMAVQWIDQDSSSEDIKTLYETSDIISVHLPLKADTVGYLNDAAFSMMVKQPFIINTARPQIVDKSALVRALSQNQIRGAACDFYNYHATNVLDPDLSPFIGRNLLLTPHIGGNTTDAIQTTAKIVVDKYVAYTLTNQS